MAARRFVDGRLGLVGAEKNGRLEGKKEASVTRTLKSLPRGIEVGVGL